MILKAPIMLSLLSLCLLPWASAAPSPSTFTPQVKEVFNAPRGWRRDGLPTPDHTVELQIGLRQPNFHVLEQHLYEVSDPDHPRYGQHLSKEQVDELVAPHDESLALVTEWLGMYGVDSDTDIGLSSARDWIRVSLPVSVVEEMLDTTYHVWKHDDGTSLVRTTSYSLPEHLHSHVDVVQPTTLFGRWKTMRSTIVESFVEDPIENAWNFVSNTLANGEVDPACNRSITVDCLLQLYNITDFTPSHPDNSIAVTGYLEQYANEADLQSFYRDQLPEAVGSSFEVISVKGGINDQNISNAGIEANLDVQFAFGVAYPIPGTFYTIAGRPPIIPENSTTNTNEPYNDWLDFILAQENPPKVISTSYGEPEQTVPFSYAQRACQGFAQLGARGVTVTFSSGDGGVGDGNPDPATQECIVFGTNTTRFQPLFPAGCPYVTAIGGTVNVPEIAVDFSGGGFSDYFARPSYQDDVVPGYINSLAPGTYTGLFNTSGRGIPDIAAEGRRFRVWYQGRTISVGGTSASSPVAAAIFALLNDIRLSKGQSTLGFVNPLLYKQDVSAAFNDITIGNNPGCGTDGFNATVGWDPITGFGTPNFGLLRELV